MDQAKLVAANQQYIPFVVIKHYASSFCEIFFKIQLHILHQIFYQYGVISNAHKKLKSSYKKGFQPIMSMHWCYLAAAGTSNAWVQCGSTLSFILSFRIYTVVLIDQMGLWRYILLLFFLSKVVCSLLMKTRKLRKSPEKYFVLRWRQKSDKQTNTTHKRTASLKKQCHTF